MDVVSWARYEAERRVGPLGDRWSHTLGVVHRAEALASALCPVDQPVLVAAAYIHDVGYAPELVSTGFHPLDGALWLRSEGQERLARLTAHHSGARFQAVELGLAGDVDTFDEERSAVADLLTYCDLTTDRDGRQVSFSARLAGIESRYAHDSVVSRGMRAAATPLAAVMNRAEREIARFAS